MLFFCAYNVEYAYCGAKGILFIEGDSADCFFVNFQGILKVLKNNEYTLKLTGEEYLNILVELYQKGCIECPVRTTKENYQLFPVVKNDLKGLKFVLFADKFAKIIRKKEMIYIEKFGGINGKI